MNNQSSASGTVGDIPLQTLCVFACTLADAAAEISLRYFKKPLSIDNKYTDGGFDPVTAADREAEQAIRTLISSAYPDHDIFGEEFGQTDKGSDFCWVLDPIDGTRAFISGLPTWGTLIALQYKGTPVVGIIDQPYLRERYLGWAYGPSLGATLNGEAITTRVCPSLEHATLSTTDPALFSRAERPAFDRVLQQSRLIRYGLDCYAYAVLAAGHIDVIVESGLKPYDMMALIPVIRGAGGVACNWQGEAPGADGQLLAVGDASLQSTLCALLASIQP